MGKSNCLSPRGSSSWELPPFQVAQNHRSGRAASSQEANLLLPESLTNPRWRVPWPQPKFNPIRGFLSRRRVWREAPASSAGPACVPVSVGAAADVSEKPGSVNGGFAFWNEMGGPPRFSGCGGNSRGRCRAWGGATPPPCGSAHEPGAPPGS